MNMKSKEIQRCFKQFTRIMLAVMVIAALGFSGWAEEKKPAISKQEQEEVVEIMCNLLNKNYVFPETAKKMSALVLKKLKKGKYKHLTSPREFARQLQVDLRSVSKDKHIRVVYSPEAIRRRKQMEKETDKKKKRDQRIRGLKKWNFGFQEVKILEGNIGYLDLRGFVDPIYGGETAVAAMNFLANCDTLIIDLRSNGGGSPGMIQLITSYFYDSEPVHLNTFYWRPNNKYDQTWTLPHVPGKRMPDTPIYVLTSKRTFSAAEEFSYNLKNLKRATLIGETTGGGAHPGGPKMINDNFYIGIPSGRAINPITKTNWEGTGVKPHIEVPGEKALDTAKIKALEELAKNSEDPEDKLRYQWYITGIKAVLSPVKVDEETLKSYAGKYGSRTITFENGALYYQRETDPKIKMIPMADDLFRFEEINYYRVKIVIEDGVVKGLKGLYENGRTHESPRREQPSARAAAEGAYAPY
jgi:C-terminal processing protease CtpA/Prc